MELVTVRALSKEGFVNRTPSGLRAALRSLNLVRIVSHVKMTSLRPVRIASCVKKTSLKLSQRVPPEFP